MTERRVECKASKVAIKPGAGSELHRVAIKYKALLKMDAGWVCVEADGPLWVRAVPEGNDE